jgi:restriction system protein
MKARSTGTVAVDGLSGIEFETWIARLLKERGFEVQGTPITGDQGADLIAKKHGKIVIIQAKCYQGTVGNKAVQEVIGALAYYGGDEGWVVTNATFTSSAKALAQKSSVRLVDGSMLKNGAI